MARLKFYADEHVHVAVTDALTRRGVDVLTVQAAGRRGLPDDEQLAYALQEGRVMVTQDSDYIALAARRYCFRPAESLHRRIHQRTAFSPRRVKCR